jgi:hypothetical protein
MPKRLIHGEALWRSDKLLEVQPESFRAELANLIPLSLANGTFKCDPRKIWADVYSYNRPEVTPEVVEAILIEFARVKILFRFTDPYGQNWGYWTGIWRPGLLPAPSQLQKAFLELYGVVGA